MKGRLVEWANKNGETCQGVVHPEDQSESFAGRLFIKVLNSDLSPKIDEKGKKLVAIKFPEDIKLIGFID